MPLLASFVVYLDDSGVNHEAEPHKVQTLLQRKLTDMSESTSGAGRCLEQYHLVYLEQ